MTGDRQGADVQRVDVALNDGRSYPILLGDDILGLPGLLDPFVGSQALVVTNDAVAARYLAGLARRAFAPTVRGKWT